MLLERSYLTRKCENEARDVKESLSRKQKELEGMRKRLTMEKRRNKEQLKSLNNRALEYIERIKRENGRIRKELEKRDEELKVARQYMSDFLF